jgi:hypothetical protein
MNRSKLLTAILATAALGTAQGLPLPADAPAEAAEIWLLSRQRGDGRWSDGARSTHDAATTALGLLALEVGEREPAERRGPAIEAALRWLCAQATDEDPLPGVSMRRELDLALVTTALGETLVGRDDAQVRELAGRATAALLGRRDPGGGWTTEFAPGEVDPALVTAWARLALGTADAARIDVGEALDGRSADLHRWLGCAGEPRGWPPHAVPRARDTAALLVMHLDGVDLAALPPGDIRVDPDAVLEAIDIEQDDPLARQLAVTAAFLNGRDLWKGAYLRGRGLDARQREDGSFAASPRWRADGGGEVSATALALLCLRSLRRFERVIGR